MKRILRDVKERVGVEMEEGKRVVERLRKELEDSERNLMKVVVMN